MVVCLKYVWIQDLVHIQVKWEIYWWIIWKVDLVIIGILFRNSYSFHCAVPASRRRNKKTPPGATARLETCLDMFKTCLRQYSACTVPPGYSGSRAGRTRANGCRVSALTAATMFVAVTRALISCAGNVVLTTTGSDGKRRAVTGGGGRWWRGRRRERERERVARKKFARGKRAGLGARECERRKRAKGP